MDESTAMLQLAMSLVRDIYVSLNDPLPGVGQSLARCLQSDVIGNIRSEPILVYFVNLTDVSYALSELRFVIYSASDKP
jgi:hypothetical protein